MNKETMLNFNIGVLGHIDSGKTSLAMALSTISSTACFDKNPQSKERGITLDLGFSAFTFDLPDNKNNEDLKKIQVTLVDCPGHASLIRTIIGGAQIIDLMLLIVDVNKGMQTQTAECLVIGEIVCDRLIIVLNKIDLIEENKRTATLEKMTKRFRKTLENTKFKDAPVVAVSAKLGQEDKTNLKELIETIRECCYIPERNKEANFIMSVDHCFTIKGQGAVMTGTILAGKLNVNDTIEIPSLKITKKIKSIQMFKQPVNSASQGDRVGVCVTQFDSNVLERGLVCTPGHLSQAYACIASVTRIAYFKSDVVTGKKFHVTFGHVTVMGRLTFFEGTGKDFSYSENYKYLVAMPTGNSDETETGEGLKSEEKKFYFALIEFENPVVCGRDFLIIGSKLDFDVHTSSCRLAFYGRAVEILADENYEKNTLPNLKVYKSKQREGCLERVVDEHTAICVQLFRKETNLDVYLNLAVALETGETGRIDGSFGQSGKVRIYFPDGLKRTTIDRCDTKAKKSNKKREPVGSANQADDEVKSQPVKVFLNFCKYLYDPSKKIKQKPL